MSITLNNDIVIAVLSVLGTLGGVWLKYKLDRAKSTTVVDPLAEAQETDMQIIDKLHQIMDKLSSDRAYIIEFHNGGKFYSGRSMQKFSMTYEVCRPGVTHEQMNYQNILASSYADIINPAINNNDNIIINDVEDVADYKMRQDMQNKGIMSMYAKVIRSLDGRIIGMLIINMVKKKHEFTEEDVQFMTHNAEIISGYLL